MHERQNKEDKTILKEKKIPTTTVNGEATQINNPSRHVALVSACFFLGVP